MHYSHLVQVLLNYFDNKDIRIRQINPFTIDAQMMNLAAYTRESTDMRISREIRANNLLQAPLNIDNYGVYFKANLPTSIPLSRNQTTLNSVIGTINSAPVELTPFDDTLPIPSGIEIDTDRSTIDLTDPVMLAMSGRLDIGGDPLPQHSGSLPLPIPNKLTFWLDNMQLNTGVEVIISGELYPRPVWASWRNNYQESISMDNIGAYTSIFRWAKINDILVRGLPEGASLRCWCLPFNLPASPDLLRPYIDPSYRDLLIPRYWQLQGNILSEVYARGLDTGLEICNTHLIPNGITSTAVEPNTYGIIYTSNTDIMYADRRTPLPLNLEAMAITKQPIYGIDASLDTSKDPSVQRWLSITPTPYVGTSVLRNRWTIQTPSNNKFTLSNSGAFITYSQYTGWRAGLPVMHTFPLVEIGTYTITLECEDSTGNITKEVVLYNNLSMVSLSTIVPEFTQKIAGFCFDSFDRAWLWTGTEAIPVKFTYDSYILDPNNGIIYLTKNYDSLQVD